MNWAWCDKCQEHHPKIIPKHCETCGRHFEDRLTFSDEFECVECYRKREKAWKAQRAKEIDERIKSYEAKRMG